jgi:hypothetical protein
MKNVSLTIAIALCPSLLFAQHSNKYECALDELTRRVEVFHETGVTVPCEVHYYKDTEMPGERQVLWRAANEEGYCEAKAEELVASLEGMGWTCWAGSDPAPREEAESDDTDALAPAEEDIEIPEPESDEPR